LGVQAHFYAGAFSFCTPYFPSTPLLEIPNLHFAVEKLPFLFNAHFRMILSHLIG